MYFHCCMDILAFKNPFRQLPISIPSSLHNRGSILEKIKNCVFSQFSIFVPGNDQIQLSLESIHLLFFILRCHICKILRTFCIFGKGRGMVQICTISSKCYIFAYVDCGNVDSGSLFRKIHVQICIIS